MYNAPCMWDIDSDSHKLFLDLERSAFKALMSCNHPCTSHIHFLRYYYTLVEAIIRTNFHGFTPCIYLYASCMDAPFFFHFCPSPRALYAFNHKGRRYCCSNCVSLSWFLTGALDRWPTKTFPHRQGYQDVAEIDHWASPWTLHSLDSISDPYWNRGQKVTESKQKWKCK